MAKKEVEEEVIIDGGTVDETAPEEVVEEVAETTGACSNCEGSGLRCSVCS